MSTASKSKWDMKGDTISACNCDWGCPCNFDAPPTNGKCEGVYAFHINEGQCDGIKLDGLTLGIAAHAPAAIHLGNLTLLAFIDKKSSASQRSALQRIVTGKAGGPFAIFAGLTTKFLGPESTSVEWHFDRSDSSKSYVRAESVMEVTLARIKNPVTGKPGGFTVNFTDGLLTDKSELMTTSAYRVNHPQMSFSHPGKYGQTFQFKFSGSF